MSDKDIIDFTKRLKVDIDKQLKVNSDAKLFIQKKKISLFKFKKNINRIDENELPVEVLLGSVYLIKGDNIIECYSYCDNSYSMYLQINKKQPVWIAKINPVNIELNDPEKVRYFLQGCSVFYLPSNYQYFIIQFLESGFQLYTKNKLI